jgi:hypothetical protein
MDIPKIGFCPMGKKDLQDLDFLPFHCKMQRGIGILIHIVRGKICGKVCTNHLLLPAYNCPKKIPVGEGVPFSGKISGTLLRGPRVKIKERKEKTPKNKNRDYKLYEVPEHHRWERSYIVQGKLI